MNAGRREYAIRGAIGAGPRAIRHLALQRAWIIGIPGLGSGAVFTYVPIAWMRDELALTVVSPFITAVLVLLPMGLLVHVSVLGPANHAARTAPAPLLRDE